MNHLLKTLLTYSTLSALCASTQAAYTEIIVLKVDESVGHELYVTTVNAQVHGAFFLETGGEVTYSTQTDLDGNLIEVADLTNSWNVYGVTLPDDWLGRSISVSVDAATWSSFKPFLNDNGSITFDDARNGNPNVNLATNVPFLGNNLLIGRWGSNLSQVLFTLETWDTGDPGWPAIGMDFMASASDVFWRWMHPSSDFTHVELAMDLDYLHRLTLRKRNAADSSQRIVIDPEAGQITINGQPLITNTAVSARRSLALGYNTTTQGYGQTVVGVNNIAVGNSLNPTDPNSEVFVVGAGSVEGYELRNAFTVKRNGNATASGALTASALLLGVGNTLGAQANATGQLVLGKFNNKRTDDGGTDHTRGSLIIGSGTDWSQTNNAMRVTEEGVVLIQEQGDISMGNFRSGPRP